MPILGALTKFVLVLIVSLLLSAPTFAAEAWSGYRKITAIYPAGMGLMFFLDGEQFNIGGACESNRMILPISSTNYDMIASALMTAYALGHQVNVNYDDTTITDCNTVINRAIIKP